MHLDLFSCRILHGYATALSVESLERDRSASVIIIYPLFIVRIRTHVLVLRLDRLVSVRLDQLFDFSLHPVKGCPPPARLVQGSASAAI